MIENLNVAYYKNATNSNWSEDGIRGVKDSCNLMGLSQDFCDCYTNEVITRISMKDFFELTNNIRKSEADMIKAQEFFNSVIDHCQISIIHENNSR